MPAIEQGRSALVSTELKPRVGTHTWPIVVEADATFVGCADVRSALSQAMLRWRTDPGMNDGTQRDIGKFAAFAGGCIHTRFPFQVTGHIRVRHNLYFAADHDELG